MSVRHPLISVYAPTMQYPDEDKNTFYSQLQLTACPERTSSSSLVISTPGLVQIGLLGRASWGIGQCNSNGKLLLDTCMAYNLHITNFNFQLPLRNRTSWMHPRSKHWHLIDYIIVRQEDRSDVRITKSMCSADCWTDHRLLVSKAAP